MDGLGRTQALGIGVGKGDRGLNASLWGVFGFQARGYERECLGEGLSWWEILGEDFETTEAGEDIGDEEGMMEKN